jgi:hypothetical protein
MAAMEQMDYPEKMLQKEKRELLVLQEKAVTQVPRGSLAMPL